MLGSPPHSDGAGAEPASNHGMHSTPPCDPGHGSADVTSQDRAQQATPSRPKTSVESAQNRPGSHALAHPQGMPTDPLPSEAFDAQ